jgi:S-layer homology domain
MKRRTRITAWSATLVRPSHLAPLLVAVLGVLPAWGAQLTLTWTDNSADEAGFRVERKTPGSFLAIADLGPNAVMYTDTGLSAGTQYCYQVRAYNAGGFSSPSNEACAFALTFADVPATYWAWRDIEALAAAGITSGCDPSRYCPESPITRGEMAVFLLKARHGSGYGPPPATGTRFDDVPATYWAAAWIEQLAREAITAGCGADDYCPGSLVTRAEMAVFLLRAKHGPAYQPPAATGAIFGDVSPTHWAAAWIEQLFSQGIAAGCGTGLYCPANPVTRAQMAVFLVRALGLPAPF